MNSEEIEKKSFTLFEVMQSIQRTIISRYGSTFWVKADMIKLNHYIHSGHCYPDLVEKKNDRTIAQARAIIWKSDYEKINKKFIEITKEPLKDGISIFFLARIGFDPVYNLSITILDIDPVVTLGQLEKERLEAINKLKTEKFFNKNKGLTLPLLPQRLAIISVESSKGYSDFMNIINQESDNYKIFTYLFPSLLQGDNAIESIIQALETVERLKHHFDCVLIIRGGGGDIGLSCYNDYELSKTIANFPIPVLTGIGHSTNETVSEMVSFKNTITPTELADFILNHFREFEKRIIASKDKIIYFSNKIIELENKHIDNIIQKLRIGISNNFITQEKKLENLEKYINILNPVNQLKRGYTITYKNGEIIKDKNELKKSDRITTHFYNGEIESIID
ncbi:MAG: exodeoxyribonuclease VII large subunit [Bacteroidales bacterium]|jgi:exodeoxyribonuclease VII large subunit|nr:exodeoxyribonuclease VII large subunit [Bacteroidales bacterium]